MVRSPLRILAVLLAAVCALAACNRPAAAPVGQAATQPVGQPAAPPVAEPALQTAAEPFDRIPPVANLSSSKRQPVNLTKPADEGDPLAVDLRQHDLSAVDLSQAGEVLLDYAAFDTETVWPAALPAGFDPVKIMELGKDPGLGVANLHRQGIAGKGVRVAFLDQTLLVGHAEYADRVEAYREVGSVDREAVMHGAAVCSLLAGKTVGVAPEVSVTYYAVQGFIGGKGTWVNHAKVINEILDANATLPPAQRIRVIGISWGYAASAPGYQETKDAIARAKREGVFVLTTTVDQDYTFKFNGLNRDPLADPNSVSAYRPGAWWAAKYYAQPELFADQIMVPMDSRTTASPTGLSAYAFYRTGGWSWVVPYLEGMYALGLQVKPSLTPAEFYQAALATGDYSTFTRDGRSYTLGPILNPAKLIAKLQG